VHFRLLLSDADYSYAFSGTRCPQITHPGGCPGTYHLSATVMDLGRYGNLKHPAKPFGTASFTVHR
jgi:hypothetical protein